MYCKLLLNMYTTQSLRVKWNNVFSSNFSVTNGVKQGRVISPILFCIYMDGLINELADRLVATWEESLLVLLHMQMT